MTEGEAIEVVAAYERLLERAFEVLSEMPHWQYLNDDDKATGRLVVTGDHVHLTWGNVGGYDPACLHIENSEPFALVFLVCSDETLAKWKAKAKVKYDAEVARNQVERSREAEAKERAQLAALQAKYGVPR